MASDTDNIAQALAIISQIESARASESLEDLTDAELLQRIAEFYSDDENERRLVLYALAVQGNPAPTPNALNARAASWKASALRVSTRIACWRCT